MDTTPITIMATLNVPIAKVWNMWIHPDDVVQWNSPSEDWHTPKAENHFEVGQKFSYNMAAKDGSMSFDFWGTYTHIEEHKTIVSELGDGRKVSVSFSTDGNTTTITETFDPEDQNSREMQQGGWQAILDNFKRYAESKA